MGKTSPEKQLESMLGNMADKTGRTLQEWLQLLKPLKLEKHGQIVKWLKSEHSVTHGFANLIANRALASKSDGADPVDAQYSGPKSALRPIYEALCTMVRTFGDDVDVSPRKTYVTLRRSKQFALIQPSTRDRVDVGINLKGTAPGERLEASGSFNAMVSHRVRISDQSEVDSELKRWLKAAYDAA